MLISPPSEVILIPTVSVVSMSICVQEFVGTHSCTSVMARGVLSVGSFLLHPVGVTSRHTGVAWVALRWSKCGSCIHIISYVFQTACSVSSCVGRDFLVFCCHILSDLCGSLVIYDLLVRDDTRCLVEAFLGDLGPDHLFLWICRSWLST